MGSLIGNISLVAGGLGLFLFGMKMMSGGLQTIAGDRMQSILRRATSNRIKAVLVGIAATIALNSSTASTVMTVSFVNSGLMNLSQAIGIIMGANLGTTFSAQLVAFRIDAYSPLFIFIGIILHMFFKKKSIKDIGYVILGFGILFFGITTMGGPLRGLGNLPAFNEMLVAFQNPLLALLAGFAFTAAVQSSTAATGILVAMYIAGVPIPFETGAFIILGTNIGTSLTTLIASIPANRASKRAALFHITFDIIGSTVFGTLIFFVPAILGLFQAAWAEPARQIAMFHTLYNSATLLLLLPFANHLAKLMERVIPLRGEDVDATYEKKLLYIDTKIIHTPAIAVHNAHQEICRMGKIANDNLALALDAFYQKDIDKANKVFENEGIVNYLNQEIASKLVWINNMELSNSEAKKIGKMFRTLTDIERIGDHAENIAEYTELITSRSDLKFSDEALQDLKTLGEVTMNLANEALYAFENQDDTKLDRVKALEETVDKLSKDYGESHINRLIAESCDPKCGAIFTDMLTDLERSGDHANNIAFSVLPDEAL